MLVRAAHAITTSTDGIRQAHLRRFPALDPERVRAIANGYDPEYLAEAGAAAESEPPGDRFLLTYAGTVFALTSARTFLEGLRRLHAREPELARLLEVRFFGRIVETEVGSFAGTEALGGRCFGPIEHERVVAELRRSHAALCLLEERPGSERIVPGKIFELMSLRLPTLVLAPQGALQEMATRHRAGDVLPAHDAEGVAATLERYLRSFQNGSWSRRSEAVDVERFDQRALAGDFARVLRQAVALARGQTPGRP
jgi:hypothetical protein